MNALARLCHLSRVNRGLGRAVVGMLVCAVAGTVLAAEDTAACDAPDAMVRLQEDRLDLPSQAAWVDARHVYWSGHAGARAGAGTEARSGRYRLVASVEGALQIHPGAPVTGLSASLPLQVLTTGITALQPAQRRRLAWMGEGLMLVAPAVNEARMRELLRAQTALVQEDADGRVVAATRLQTAALIDALYPGAVRALLGAAPQARQTRFGVWAPTAAAVSLCLYPDPVEAAQARVPMTRDAATGAWQAQVPGDLDGRYYRYLVEVHVPGTGRVRNRVTDPYSASLSADSQRSLVADLSRPAYMPAGWSTQRRPAPLARPTDLAAYEVHVRDFSAHDETVPPALRGKYAAFTQAQSAGMQHLRALAQAGMTEVHLLPVFDFSTVPETGCVTPAPAGGPDDERQQAEVVRSAAADCYNWGYDPWHFNAPEGSYASDAQDGRVRVRELRAVVQALHAAGLRVGMDVVYNHTSASGQRPASVLDRIVPGYYHRLDAQGRVERSTCCDNTATEHRMMARLMADSVAWWARHYRIDSFRFDLMGHIPREAVLAARSQARRAAGRPVQFIGEGWDFGEVARGARFVQAVQTSLGGSRVGSFNDRLRDAVRGARPTGSWQELQAQPGWINGVLARDPAGAALAADQVRAGLAGSVGSYRLTGHDGRRRALRDLRYGDQPLGYAQSPDEVVNYVENHDDLTLFDLNVLRMPEATTPRERAQAQLVALALTAFAQGRAYFHGGVELMRSKSLDRNSFDSGDWFNRLNWTGEQHAFGSGLPPAQDNAVWYPLMRERLGAAASIRPAPQDIRFVRDGLRDLLRIRSGSRLFRLDSASAIARRLHFPGAGAAQNPAVVAGWLRGRGLPGAGFEEIVYLVNAADTAQELTLKELSGREWRLHPVHLAAGAADARPAREARVDAASGRFEVPARSAVVFVRAEAPSSVHGPRTDTAGAAASRS